MNNSSTTLLSQQSIELHAKNQGKLNTISSVPLANRSDLSIAYTPGVGAVCQLVASNPENAYSHTIKGHAIAVISDGTAVLGLGNIGPLGALPVMEGKAIIFKQFANLDAWPLVLDVHSTEEIVRVIKAIAPGFGAINLEDIAAPACFEIEAALQDLGIPVMHDDQHGTAIVVYAALSNAARVMGKKLSDLTVVVNGAGAAGLATAKMLNDADQTGADHVKNLIICDSKGIISAERKDLNPYKQALIPLTNLDHKTGDLTKALEQADVFIGVSAPGALTAAMIQGMSPNPIVFAMANPIPEIYPDAAYAVGAAICGTGRSDLPNQINNALVFPGIFKAAMDLRKTRITPAMKYAAARGVAKTITPTKEQILPDIFHPSLVSNIIEEITALE